MEWVEDQGVGLNFYKRYTGDYARKTRHLSFAEHGAYTLMMDLYYDTEKPLPADRQELYKKLCAKTPEECAAIDSILSQFFIARCTRKKCNPVQKMCNKRADEEISKYKKLVKSGKMNGPRGGRPKKQNNQNPFPTLSENNHIQNQNQNQNQIHIQKNQSQIQSQNPPAQPAGATQPPTYDRRKSEARDLRLRKEEEARREAQVGRNPYSDTLEELRKIGESKKLN